MHRSRLAILVVAFLAFASLGAVAVDGSSSIAEIRTAPRDAPLAPPGQTSELLAVDAFPIIEWVDGVMRAEWYAGVQRAIDEAEWFAGVARAAAAARAAPRSVVVVAPVVITSDAADCGGVNWYAAEIYRNESGCRTWAVNGGGCAGIGQACPGSKLPCSLDDFACQHAYFEGYAFARYGSWENAYAFWQRNRWW